MTPKLDENTELKSFVLDYDIVCHFYFKFWAISMQSALSTQFSVAGLPAVQLFCFFDSENTERSTPLNGDCCTEQCPVCSKEGEKCELYDLLAAFVLWKKVLNLFCWFSSTDNSQSDEVRHVFLLWNFDFVLCLFETVLELRKQFVFRQNLNILTWESPTLKSL